MIFQYRKLIDDLNNGKIGGFYFSVKNYAHYNHCVIKREKDRMPNGKEIILIIVKLTNDGTEKIAFWDSFKEDIKIFKMGRRGSFTLNELWEEIEVLQILEDTRDR